MIGLRTDDDIDARCATGDFGALGLCDAAGYSDNRRAAVVSTLTTDVGIDFFGCLFANVTGVEDDEIGVFAIARRGHAARTQ